MDEEVEPAAEHLDLAEDPRQVVVRADVALGDEQARRSRRGRARSLDPLALIGEGDLRSSSARRRAIAHAIERRLATPSTSACFPSSRPATRRS